MDLMGYRWWSGIDGLGRILYCSLTGTNDFYKRSTHDIIWLPNCTAGDHPADPHSLPKPQRSYLSCMDDLPDRLKIAFSPDLGYARVQKEVAVRAFEEMGHAVEVWTGSLPDMGEVWAPLVCTDIFAQLGDLLLQAARAYEKVRPWNDRWPGM
jgi:Asp-tRNA(Asn)/Glu-tRNA(Gln) amidotransferase A subunit family amidase